MVLTEARVKIEMADDLSDETIDRLSDMHADDMSAALDMELGEVAKRLRAQYGGAGIPGLKVVVEVE